VGSRWSAVVGGDPEEGIGGEGGVGPGGVAVGLEGRSVGLRRSAEVTRLGGDGDGIDAIPVSSLLFGLLFAEACVGRVFRVYEKGESFQGTQD
jgi:hypothetical protein